MLFSFLSLQILSTKQGMKQRRIKLSQQRYRSNKQNISVHLHFEHRIISLLFRCGNKFSCILYFFFFLSASTAIPLSELLNKGSGAQFCHVLDFYFNSDNLERVIYANIVTISQKKWCCLINMNKSDAICSIPTLLSAERPFWLWTRTKDSTIKWHQNYSLYLRRFFLSFFPRAYLHKLNYLPKMFISACFSDKSVQMNYSAGKNHAIIYCYDA